MSKTAMPAPLAPAPRGPAARRSRAPRNLDTDQLLLTIEQWLGQAGAVNYSLRGAADAAGVSSTTLLRHFGSREGLIEALISHRNRFNMEDLRRRAKRCGSFAAALRELLDRPPPMLASEARIVVQIAALALSQSTSGTDSFSEVLRSNIDTLKALLIGDGVPETAALDLSQFILSATSGFISSYANSGDESALVNNYRRLYRHVLEDMDAAAWHPAPSGQGDHP